MVLERAALIASTSFGEQILLDSGGHLPGEQRPAPSWNCLDFPATVVAMGGPIPHGPSPNFALCLVSPQPSDELPSEVATSVALSSSCLVMATLSLMSSLEQPKLVAKLLGILVESKSDPLLKGISSSILRHERARAEFMPSG